MADFKKKDRRLPAEWEEQDGVLLAWPHEKSDWASDLERVENVFAEIITWISLYERIVLVVPEKIDVKTRLGKAGANLKSIAFFSIETNDTWARDFGPIFIRENGGLKILDFSFNGWGLKYASNFDNLITRRLYQNKIFGKIPVKTLGLVLEGGSIESDGKGTIMTTSECLLSPNRNPGLSKKKIEKNLKKKLGAKRIIWLNNGSISGDDTDSHIDMLARFCSDDTICYISCDDKKDENFIPLLKMKKELENLRTIEGNPYRLIPLPIPAASFDSEGNRLPASYANFLVINKALLMPAYDNDEKDSKARLILKETFPGREIIGVNCLPIIRQHGSLHCLTMQLPKGALPV